jgi:two-component system, NtrC family, sensor kinase
MKRRSKVGGERAKVRRRPKAAKLKRSTASNAPPRSRADGQGEVALLARELNDAREQQTATAGVLRMISGSLNDSQSILETIVRMAGELCASEYSILFRLRDGKYHVACSNNAAAKFVRFFSRNPISVNEGSLVGRTALARRAVHIEDCLADPD